MARLQRAFVSGFLIALALHAAGATGKASGTRTNVALASNGSAALASSTAGGRWPVVSAIDGDRTGNTWGSGTGGWNDGTRGVFPDILEVDFPISEMVDQINVFTLQNNWTTAGEPNLTTPATGEGILDFDVQTWNGQQWVTVPGGSVTGNDKAWRQFTFPGITTTKIRVVVNNSRNNYSRIVELEAFGIPGFADVITQILAEPYQPAYAPAGFDSAFPVDSANTTPVPNTAPAQDYTSGSIPGDPDHPNWPAVFQYVTASNGLVSGDGAPLRGRLALHSGLHPGIVVVHGFNTNGKESVIRWAAMLYANGYNVLAADQRDFKDESDHSEGYPNWLQTFGWKESQDVLAAGAYLKAQPGVTSVGVVGFSEGAQNTILALAHDSGGIFSAGLTFSPPADQDTQIYSGAAPPGCTPGLTCDYPSTDALIVLVVPPFGHYHNPCAVLADAQAKYGATPAAIFGEERAYHAQTSITVPLLNFYANDDSLVAPFQATMMAGYEAGRPLQKTLLIARGEHAYFFDRWWHQRSILLYFKSLLPGAALDSSITTTPTVNQTPMGTAMSGQLVSLGNPTTADADAFQAPLICPGP